MKMIMPLIEDGIDKALVIERKKRIAQENELSYRTITRYHEAYIKEGFEGLKPKSPVPRKQDQLPEDFPDIVDEAIELRRECPTRSIKDIIKILELEDRIEKGAVSRSTLQRHLQKRGFGAGHIKIYTKKGAAARRFQKEHRGILYQGDIKYGPYLPIGKNGARKQVYLSVFIDDATRYIVSAKFYENQKVEIIEDSLRTAIMYFGKPTSIFVDNGKQYRSNWLKRACTTLGIKLLFAKPYSPEGKGKVEFFNRRVDSFLSEVALMNIQSLDELNKQLDIWINEYYHKSEHSGLGGISPEVAFKTDKKPLKFINIETCTEAFLHREERLVDKTGCISFEGRKYEVGVKLMGRKVEVNYDPTWKDEVEIHYDGYKPFKAKVMVIGSNCGSKQSLPEEMTPLKPKTSRLLDGLNKANITNRTKKEVAVVFRKNREDKSNV